MGKSITQKYNSKKRNASERNIPFSLTIKEYQELLSTDKCAYTGVEFGDTLPEVRSIERVIDEEGYHFWNCVVTTVKANQLKDIVVKDCGKLPISDIELIPKIKKSYEEHKARILKEKSMSSENDSLTERPHYLSHEDVMIAKSYTEFALNAEDEGFVLSFSMYKKKLRKTKCELSGKVFSSENGTYLRKKITKKDYTKPFSDDNVTVICQVFDNMLRNNLFTKKELIKASEGF